MNADQWQFLWRKSLAGRHLKSIASREESQLGTGRQAAEELGRATTFESTRLEARDSNCWIIIMSPGFKSPFSADETMDETSLTLFSVTMKPVGCDGGLQARGKIRSSNSGSCLFPRACHYRPAWREAFVSQWRRRRAAALGQVWWEERRARNRAPASSPSLRLVSEQGNSRPSAWTIRLADLSVSSWLHRTRSSTRGHAPYSRSDDPRPRKILISHRFLLDQDSVSSWGGRPVGCLSCHLLIENIPRSLVYYREVQVQPQVPYPYPYFAAMSCSAVNALANFDCGSQLSAESLSRAPVWGFLTCRPVLLLINILHAHYEPLASISGREPLLILEIWVFYLYHSLLTKSSSCPEIVYWSPNHGKDCRQLGLRRIIAWFQPSVLDLWLRSFLHRRLPTILVSEVSFFFRGGARECVPDLPEFVLSFTCSLTHTSYPDF